MDISLHLGCHRSGTTTLQRLLEANRAALAAGGTAVWTPKQIRAGLFSGIEAAPGAQTDERARQARRAVGRIRTLQQQLERDGAERLIVSEENIAGTMRANLRRGALYPDFAARLAAYRPAFAGDSAGNSAGAGLTIALGIRSYEMYWASALTYCLGRNLPIPEAGAIAALARQPRRWRHMIEEIAAVFSEARIVVWPFERWGAQPERQLAQLNGGFLPAVPLARKRERANASLHLPELRRRLDEAGGTRPLLPRHGDGRWMPFDEVQAAAMRAAYRQDLHWLRAGADGRACLVTEALCDDSEANLASTTR